VTTIPPTDEDLEPVATLGATLPVPIYFRMTGVIDDLFINAGDTMTLDFDGPQKVVLSISKPPKVDVADSQNANYQLTFEAQPSAKVRAMFESLAADRMPEGSRPGSTVLNYDDNSSLSFNSVDEDGQLKPGAESPIPLLPEAFGEFVKRVAALPRELLSRGVKVLRWRADQRGGPEPLTARTFEWSIDQKTWRGFAGRITGRISTRSAYRLSGEHKADIEEYVKDGVGEPVSHELLREAYAIANHNPRSGLVIGIAACEIGVKLCIGNLVPDATWLVENVPSPPVERMLREYMPNMPASYRIDGKVLSPPARILAVIKKGVLLRNQIIHKGASVTSDTCEEVFQAVSDVLWLCDYYSGYAWALNYLSSQTSEELGVREES
jgi:hypothetical protein